MAAHMLLLVINDRRSLDSILRALRRAGVGGATVVESTGMGRTLSGSVPLIGGLRHLKEGLSTHNHTLFAVIPDEMVLQRATEQIHKEMGDFSGPGSGMMTVWPLTEVWGGSRNAREEDPR